MLEWPPWTSRPATWRTPRPATALLLGYDPCPAAVPRPLGSPWAKLFQAKPTCGERSGGFHGERAEAAGRWAVDGAEALGAGAHLPQGWHTAGCGNQARQRRCSDGRTRCMLKSMGQAMRAGM